MFEAKEHFVRTPPIVALVLLLGLAGPIAARAEVVSVPQATLPNAAETLPPPTILRGSPPSPPKPFPAPTCPPGYVPSADYGCIAPAGGEYAEGWPDYDYWPDYWYGYPGYGYPFSGRRAGRFHRSAGFRSFQRPVRFGGFGIAAGHMGGFGRR
jgi:hypothetical protein